MSSEWAEYDAFEEALRKGEVGSSPVKDAYWVISNAEGKIVDRHGFIIPLAPEVGEEEIEDEDFEEEYTEEDGCSCGYYCMDCLGMSWRDFM